MASAYGEDCIASTKLVLKFGERDPLTVHVIIIIIIGVTGKKANACENLI